MFCHRLVWISVVVLSAVPGFCNDLIDTFKSQKFETRSFDDAINSEFSRIEFLEKNPNLKINNPDFDNAVIFNYIRHGIYVDKIRTWFELFPKDQIQILPTNLLTNESKSFQDLSAKLNPYSVVSSCSKNRHQQIIESLSEILRQHQLSLFYNFIPLE